MIKIIIWGTDQKLDYVKKLINQYIKTNTKIISLGYDDIYYKYNSHKMFDALFPVQISALFEEHKCDMVLLSSDIRYLSLEYNSLLDAGIPEDSIYAVPSYLYSKENIVEEDIRAIFTPYNQLKPQLYYLELHAADHCNLNCKGCTHFSNIVKKPKFPDLKELSKDLERMSQLFQNIEYIRILGGEPLLNPQLDKMLDIVRRCFPYAKILVVTNGLLVRKMKSDLITSIRRNKVQVTVSIYPPLEGELEAMEEFLRENDICYQFGERQKGYEVCKVFEKFLNLNGNSEPEKSFIKCKRRRCTFLHEGKISACALPALIKYFNEYFKTNIIADNLISIHDDCFNLYGGGRNFYIC